MRNPWGLGESCQRGLLSKSLHETAVRCRSVSQIHRACTAVSHAPRGINIEPFCTSRKLQCWFRTYMYMAPHLDVLHQVVLKALYGMRFASQRTLVGSRARERDFPGLPVLGPCRPAGGGGTCLPAARRWAVCAEP